MFDWCFEDDNSITLLDSPPKVKRDVKPVWVEELNLLGIDRFFSYDKTEQAPLLWRCQNRYFYRGQLVFKTHNKGWDEPPEIELTPLSLLPSLRFEHPIPLDKMCQRNAPLLQRLTDETINLMRDVIRDHGSKHDAFVCCFSGGKDSTVLFDITRQALKNVPFYLQHTNTTMEFEETEAYVQSFFEGIKEENITCLINKSDIDALETWEKIGFPGRVLRWCCKVHKVAPSQQTLLNLGITAPLNIAGQRSDESIQRSKYITYSTGELGFASAKPLLTWGGAEIWLYLLSHNIPFNALYKKGLKRVGCVLCPCSGANFTESVLSKKAQLLKDVIRGQISQEIELTNQRWRSQKGGRFLKKDVKCIVEKGKITPVAKKDDCNLGWLDVISESWHDSPYTFAQTRGMGTLKKGYLIKAFYCIGCGVCAIYCKQNAISFENQGDKRLVHIDPDKCIHCFECLYFNEKAHDFCVVHARQRLSLKETLERVEAQKKGEQ